MDPDEHDGIEQDLRAGLRRLGEGTRRERRLERTSTLGGRWGDGPATVRDPRGDHRQSDRERYEAQLEREGAQGLSREAEVEAEQHVERTRDGVPQAEPADELRRHHAHERSLWDSSARREALADHLDHSGVDPQARSARLAADHGQAAPPRAAVQGRQAPETGVAPAPAPSRRRTRVRPARRAQSPTVTG